MLVSRTRVLIAQSEGDNVAKKKNIQLMWHMQEVDKNVEIDQNSQT